jgi:hypothetical protein
MKTVVRNDTSVLLIIAAIFTGATIPVMSGFLEPSQPPAVEAVEVGMPEDDSAGARKAGSQDGKRGRDRGAERGAGRGRDAAADRRRPARDRPRPAQSPPAVSDDDGAGDDAD